MGSQGGTGGGAKWYISRWEFRRKVTVCGQQSLRYRRYMPPIFVQKDQGMAVRSTGMHLCGGFNDATHFYVLSKGQIGYTSVAESNKIDIANLHNSSVKRASDFFQPFALSYYRHIFYLFGPYKKFGTHPIDNIGHCISPKYLHKSLLSYHKFR